MSVVDTLRKAYEWLIRENPVSVTLHRTEKIDDGAGGWIPREFELPSFDGRLIPSRVQMQEQTNEAGTLRLSAWSLLAPWTADLQVGDTFTANGQTFRIRRVVRRKHGGSDYGLQANLEEMI